MKTDGIPLIKNYNHYSTPMRYTQKRSKAIAVIVAHPDDETIWAGGTMLRHPSWGKFTLSLCRKHDTDRAPKFFQALNALGSAGALGDLDDGPQQEPLADHVVQAMILQLLPREHFDIIISHSPLGEYTRHARHEETGRAVSALWHAGIISAGELWAFAYEDGGRAYLPRAIKKADRYTVLPESTWRKKYHIITATYGFHETSYEAQTTPRSEAFWIHTAKDYPQAAEYKRFQT